MSEKVIVYDKDACATGEAYNWITYAATMFYEDGWYDGTMQKTDSVLLPRGVGLYFYCPTVGASIQFSGKVSPQAQTNDLIYAGYNVIGNSTPVKVNLQDITLIGGTGLMSEKIIVYDKDACATGAAYNWITYDATMFYEDGWYDGTMQKVSDVELEPGEGVYLYCTTPNVKYTLPAAIK